MPRNCKRTHFRAVIIIPCLRLSYHRNLMLILMAGTYQASGIQVCKITSMSCHRDMKIKRTKRWRVVSCRIICATCRMFFFFWLGCSAPSVKLIMGWEGRGVYLFHPFISFFPPLELHWAELSLNMWEHTFKCRNPGCVELFRRGGGDLCLLRCFYPALLSWEPQSWESGGWVTLTVADSPLHLSLDNWLVRSLAEAVKGDVILSSWREKGGGCGGDGERGGGEGAWLCNFVSNLSFSLI